MEIGQVERLVLAVVQAAVEVGEDLRCWLRGHGCCCCCLGLLPCPSPSLVPLSLLGQHPLPELLPLCGLPSPESRLYIVLT